ncbi:adiponectin receptor protein 1-like [Lytechinus variegatus]|uniref:adiponectin receptor protein 1-like n=1 Tax=Lytechinus variegatus TaxID=7654 RepID=UPI001BB26506|nr:adiponectin receptor protein 1-like [Lytechinus variegatus]
MNKSPDLGERRGDEEDTTPNPQTFLLSSQPDQASPSSTSGIVRRRIKKKRQPRSSQPQGSDSDSMDEDPEVGSNQPLRDDQEPRDPSTITVEEVTEVEETSTLRSSDGEKEVKELEVEPQPAGGSDSEYDFALLKQQADELAHKFVQKVKDVTWKVTHHNFLPDWLKDNDYLHYHHRPPLPSFRTCFKSIFRIHTETGNIWTHLLGCIAFIIIAIYFLVQSIMSRDDWQEIVAYMMFFLGAILCLGFSCLFHTCYCHSSQVSKIFSKLDYSGITFLIVGSFVPWLYFGFYCENITRYVYLALILVLGALCLFVALRDTFSLPKYRPLRAGLYVALGLSGVIPAIHYVSINSFLTAIQGGGLGWMILMACLYISGALLYAIRIPERFFPGKCDIWFQSHQIFHVLVLAAAFVHYHGINTMAAYREQIGECNAGDLYTDIATTVEN